MQELSLELEKRTELSKKARAKALENGKVLGNIYGRGVESIAIEAPYQIVYKTVKAAGKNHPITLVIKGGETVDALVHDVEYSPRTFAIHHVTFKIVKKGEKVKTDIPVHIIGEAPAAKLGLIMVTVTDSVEVETIPSKLPEAINVDVSKLEEEGDAIRISDIDLDAEVEVMIEPDTMLVRIEAPRAIVAEEEEEEEGEEGEEGSEDGEEGSEETAESAE